MTITTKTRLGNTEYPSLNVFWEPHALGWKGVTTIWESSHVAKEETHEIYVGLTAPIGRIVVHFDGHEHGCMAMADLVGDTITNRDLQWAAVWAKEVIRGLPEDLK